MNNSQIQALINIIAEEYGEKGYFSSMYADMMFKEAFCDWGENVEDGMKKLLTLINKSES